jgi:hypothetical protein
MNLAEILCRPVVAPQAMVANFVQDWRTAEESFDSGSWTV